MFLPALPSFARDMGVSPATASFAVSGYLAATTVMLLLAGPLSDRYGRRQVMLGAMALFVIASLCCALAETFALFLAARLLQAAIVAGFAIPMAVIRDTYPPEAATRRIALLSMFMGLAPMIGPAIGGTIDEALGWRAVFWVHGGFGLLLMGWCLHDLVETRATGLRPPRQMAQMRALMTRAEFWAYALCIAFSLGVFYTFIAAIPVVAEASLGLDPAQIGLGVGSITIGFVLGSWVASQTGQNVAIPRMMLWGRVIAWGGLALGLWAIWGVGASPYLVFGVVILAGLGNGLALPSANAGVMSVDPSLAGSAAGVSGAMAVATGAILTAATAPIVAQSPTSTTLLCSLLVVASAALAAAIWSAWLSQRAEKTTPPGPLSGI